MDFSLQLGPSSGDLAMMLPQCSHITRKRGIYFYRRRVPGHPTREIAVSLRTRRLGEARWLASELDREFGRIIASVTESKKTADVQAIARQYLTRKLDFDMELRISSPHVGVYSRSTEPGCMVAEELEWVDGELATARSEFLERLYDHQRPLIDELMAEHGVPNEQREALAFAILRANVESWQVIRKRTLGNFDPPTPAATESVNGHHLPDRTVSGKQSPLFSEVLPGFIDLMVSSEGWRGQTLAQNQATYRMFVEVCGDRAVARTCPASTTRFAAFRSSTLRAVTGADCPFWKSWPKRRASMCRV